MPPRKWIDKKSATTYNVVHRSHEDPLYHDDEAAQNVLVKADNLNAKEAKQARKDKWISGAALQAQAADFARAGRRENEGEAALYGITFDDSTYDYMQHLKPMGQHGDAIFLDKAGKAKPTYNSGELMFREDAPPGTAEEEGGVELELPAEMLPSEQVVPVDYQRLQSVPDAISGLRPDMDPRLREVLEALEDEEYIDETDDLFAELVEGGEVANEKAWRAAAPREEVVRRDGEEDWEFEFRKFQNTQKAEAAASDDEGFGSDVGSDFGSDFGSEVSAAAAPPAAVAAAKPAAAARAPASEAGDTLGALPNIAKKPKKKRIGAKTDLSGYSMSSSANYRTKGLQLLDDRFDLIEEEYARESDSEEEEPEFDMAKERDDLEAIMDDFLDNYMVEGRKLYRRGPV